MNSYTVELERLPYKLLLVCVKQNTLLHRVPCCGWNLTFALKTESLNPGWAMATISRTLKLWDLMLGLEHFYLWSRIFRSETYTDRLTWTLILKWSEMGMPLMEYTCSPVNDSFKLYMSQFDFQIWYWLNHLRRSTSDCFSILLLLWEYFVFISPCCPCKSGSHVSFIRFNSNFKKL